MTFVQATFVLETYVHIRNISAVSFSGLDQAFWTQFFWGHNFCGSKCFRTTLLDQNFPNPNFFQIQIFLLPNIFEPQFYWTKNSFKHNIFLDTNFLSPTFFSEPKFFRSQLFFNFFFNQKSLWTQKKISDPKFILAQNCFGTTISLEPKVFSNLIFFWGRGDFIVFYIPLPGSEEPSCRFCSLADLLLLNALPGVF